VNAVVELVTPPEVKREGLCSKCGQYLSVYGLCYASLKVPSGSLPDGFYRSDIEFGYKLMMFPMWIVTEKVKTEIRAARMTGFSFKPIPIAVE
jgi:hypothetical protein